MKKLSVQVVWFKRDLRVRDHLPLYRAAHRGPVLPLYIVDPGLVHETDFSPAHWTFIAACLTDLRENLEHVGQSLIVRIGEAVTILQSLERYVKIDAIWTHQETGNAYTQRRNQRVATWAEISGIPLHTLTQHGALGDGDAADWETAWNDFMTAAPVPLPQMLKVVDLVPGRIPDGPQLRLGRDTCPDAPAGGESAAATLLDDYLGGAPPPPLAPPGATALDPLIVHLAYGTISSRRVFQKLKAARQSWRTLDDDEKARRGPGWRRSLTAWEKTLRRRAWYRAQLLAQPDLIARAALPEFDQQFPGSDVHLNAWQRGATGYPLIDAALTSLSRGGWLPPSLNELLITFAVLGLNLPWPAVATTLARHSLGYDPDVFYPQVQTLIGALLPRGALPDPVRLSQQLDPAGEFLRRQLPALAGLPAAQVHTPWQLPMWERDGLNFELGRDYPAPLISHTPVARRARQKLAALWGPAGENGHSTTLAAPAQLSLGL